MKFMQREREEGKCACAQDSQTDTACPYLGVLGWIVVAEKKI